MIRKTDGYMLLPLLLLLAIAFVLYDCLLLKNMVDAHNQAFKAFSGRGPSHLQGFGRIEGGDPLEFLGAKEGARSLPHRLDYGAPGSASNRPAKAICWLVSLSSPQKAKGMRAQCNLD